jgi:hypothetical protein
MRQRAGSILAVICLVFCGLLVAAWVRGYFASDSVAFGRSKPGGRMWVSGFVNGRGGLAFAVVTDNPYDPQIEGPFWQRERPGYAGGIDKEPNTRGAAGFLYVHIGGSPRGWAVAAPLWFLLPLAGAWPAWHYRGLLRRERRRRERLGLCLYCGYDLRASNERCPECGEPVPAMRCPSPSPNPTPLPPTAPALDSPAGSSRS